MTISLKEDNKILQIIQSKQNVRMARARVQAATAIYLQAFALRRF